MLFVRFYVKEPKAVITYSPASSNHTLKVQEHEVRCILRAVSPGKASGPDPVTGRVLKESTLLHLHNDLQPFRVLIHHPTKCEVQDYHPTAKKAYHQQP